VRNGEATNIADRPEIGMHQIGPELWVADLRGEHDTATRADLRRELDRALDGGASMVVDLSAAAYIDSSIIAEIVRAHRRASSTPGASLAVVAPVNSPAGIVFDLGDADGRVLPRFASRGAAIEACRRRPPPIHYVQVRYPHGEHWVAVGVTDDRREAAAVAAVVFRERANSSGEAPSQVRVIDASRLVAEGGQEAINRAAADLWTRTAPT
jgi:anti-sigma B factor antagonist